MGKKIVLTYFDGRGRAEPIRMCLAHGGIKFEDKRVEQAQWPQLKDSECNIFPDLYIF